MSILPLDGITGLVNTVISRIWPDKEKQQERSYDLAEKQLDADSAVKVAQNKVNEASANNPSFFVSGARAFVVWICGFVLGWEFLAKPMLSYFIVLFGYPAPNLPSLDIQSLLRILLGLLGLN